MSADQECAENSAQDAWELYAALGDKRPQSSEGEGQVIPIGELPPTAQAVAKLHEARDALEALLSDTKAMKAKFDSEDVKQVAAEIKETGATLSQMEKESPDDAALGKMWYITCARQDVLSSFAETGALATGDRLFSYFLDKQVHLFGLLRSALEKRRPSGPVAEGTVPEDGEEGHAQAQAGSSDDSSQQEAAAGKAGLYGC